MKLPSAYQLKRGYEYFRKHGVKQFVRRFQEKTGVVETEYPGWFREHRPSEAEFACQRAQKFSREYSFSFIVPAYQTPEPYLRKLIESLRAQTYKNWELCLADGSPERKSIEEVVKSYQDPRLRYLHLEKNYGISGNTNQALAMARGDFLVLSDHDDFLEPDALYRMMEVLEQDPETDAIYTDEGKITMEGDRLFDPHFKSDFNWWLLRSNNYICHIFAVRTCLGREVGGFQAEYDGAQDYDFILKCCEKARRVAHIPRVLYHWRAHPGSTAGDPASKSYAYEAGCKALNAHYKRMGIQAQAEYTGLPGRYRTRFQIQENPEVAVLLTYTGKERELLSCVKALKEGTSYKNWKLWVLVGKHQKISQKIVEKLKDVKFFRGEGGTLTQLWNQAASVCEGSYLVFLKGAYRPYQCDWLEELLGQCSQKEVGVAGGKILYRNRRICQAGVYLGMYGVAGNASEGAKYLDEGYSARTISNRNVSAVTDVVMTRRQVWEQLSGIRNGYGSYLGMVDYCLRAAELGWQIVYTPYMQLRSFYDLSKRTNHCRWKEEERQRFLEDWKSFLEKGDPYYSPNLSLLTPDYRYRRKDENIFG